MSIPSWVGRGIPDSIVAPIHIETPPNLLLSQRYDKIGRTNILEARPERIVFHGFQLHKTYTQRLYLLNVSTIPTRVDVLEPDSSFFKIKINKKGRIPSGISEVVKVEFTPTEYRVYNDIIRIHAEGTNLMVPLQALPFDSIEKSEEFVFPKYFDVGSVDLGATGNKELQIPNNLPVPLEFELKLLDETMEFDISPMEGVIEPGEILILKVSYTPIKRATSSVRVKWIQKMGPSFEFQLMARGLEVTEIDNAIDLNANTENLNRSSNSTKTKYFLSSFYPHAVGDDSKEVKALLKTILSNGHDPIPPEYGISPIKVSKSFSKESLDTPYTVNKFLMTQPGKLEKTAAKRAMVKLKLQQEEVAKAMLAATATMKSSLSQRIQVESERFDYSLNANKDVEFIGDSKQMKSIIFDRYFVEKIEYENRLLLQARLNRIGQVLLTNEEIDTIKKIWKEKEARIAKQDIKKARENFTLTVSEKPVVHLEPTISANFYGLSKSSTEVIEHVPDFDLFKNDTWKMRKSSLRSFQQLVTDMNTERRIASRIEAVSKFISMHKLTKGNKLSLTEISKKKVVKGLNGNKNASSELPIAKLFTLDKIVENVLPPDDSGSSLRAPYKVDAPIKFVDHVPFALPMPDEWKLKGYSSLAQSIYPTYLPIEENKKLRTGALEEDLKLFTKIKTSNNIVEQSIQSKLLNPSSIDISAPANPLIFVKSNCKLPGFSLARIDEIAPDAIFTHPDHVCTHAPIRLKPQLASYRTGGITTLELPNSSILQQWQPTFIDISSSVCDSKLNLLVAKPQEDIYSDSESEDDEEGLAFKPLLPNSEIARSLFDNDVPQWSPLDVNSKDAKEKSKPGSKETAKEKSIVSVLPPLKQTSFETFFESCNKERENKRRKDIQEAIEAPCVLNEYVTNPRLKVRPLITKS